MTSDSPSRCCQGSNPGHLHDKQEYSPLYYNDILVFAVSIDEMSNMRPVFVASIRVAVKFVYLWAAIPRSAAKFVRLWAAIPRTTTKFFRLWAAIPRTAFGRERSYDDMRPASRTTDCTPQGLESGRAFRGTRKALKIWWCGNLGGNVVVNDIGFAFALLPGMDTNFE